VFGVEIVGAPEQRSATDEGVLCALRGEKANSRALSPTCIAAPRLKAPERPQQRGRFHEFAFPAVRASECAADVGKFGAMHDVLYEYQGSIGSAPWWWFANTARLQDSDRFETCMAQPGPIPALAADTTAAHRLGAKGTPTLLIHEIRLNGLPFIDSLRACIERVGGT
jgi:hypothetical protein